MNRLESNRKILNILNDMVETQTECRFHQILHNAYITIMDPEFDDNGRPNGIMKVRDQYNEESVNTLKRILTNLNKYE